MDCSQGEWDKAMSFFNSNTRGYLANKAAHGFIIIELQEGDIMVLHYFEGDEDPLPRAVCTEVWRNEDDEGTSLYDVDAKIYKKYIDYVISEIKVDR